MRLETFFAALLGLAIAFVTAPSSHAQLASPTASAWPFAATPRPSATPPSTPPPRNIPLVERTWEALADHAVSLTGKKAFDIKPDQWKHAETENFILHFRRLRDVSEVAREIEFDLWFVASALGATKPQYQRRSHVYIFKDENEWQDFLGQTNEPNWAHSFALNDELFLNVREDTGTFDSQSVAHETTHAVVARLYRRHWPLWLNEGFAEFMGRASVAARHGQSIRRFQNTLQSAEMSVGELTSLTEYPSDRLKVDQLYETSEKLVRYLCNRYAKELFPKFVDHLLGGEPLQAALIATYGNDFKDMAAFEKKFARFTR